VAENHAPSCCITLLRMHYNLDPRGSSGVLFLLWWWWTSWSILKRHRPGSIAHSLSLLFFFQEFTSLRQTTAVYEYVIRLCVTKCLNQSEIAVIGLQLDFW